MPIFHKPIEIKLTRRWKELGYEVTRTAFKEKRNVNYTSVFMDDLFKLFPNSQNKIAGTCDECGAYFSRQVCCIKHFDDGIIRCKQCTHKKLYSNKEFVNNATAKMKATNLKRYGKELPSQTEDVKERMKATCLKKYGTEWGAQSKIVKDKMKMTCLKRYRVEHVFQEENVKEKIKQTNLKKYGAEHAAQNQTIKGKIFKSFFKHGIKTSKQQVYLHNLLGGILNFRVKYWYIDIGFEKEKIALEYDGGGHDLAVRLGRLTREEFELKEIKRVAGLYAEGWKIVRFISPKDKFLDDAVITEIFDFCKNFLLKTEHHWIKVFFDTGMVKCSEFEISIESIRKERI